MIAGAPRTSVRSAGIKWDKRREHGCALKQAKWLVQRIDGIEAPVSDRPLCTSRTIVVATEAKGPDHGLNTLGKPGNVG
jgi:hypothetical protein